MGGLSTVGETGYEYSSTDPKYDTDVSPGFWWGPDEHPYVQLKNDTPYPVAQVSGKEYGE